MTPKISGSQPGAILSPQVHLAMSGILLVVMLGGGGTEAGDEAEHPTVHRMVPTKNDLAHMSVEQRLSSPAGPLAPRAPNGGTPTSAFLTELPSRSRTCNPVETQAATLPRRVPWEWGPSSPRAECPALPPEPPPPLPMGADTHKLRLTPDGVRQD